MVGWVYIIIFFNIFYLLPLFFIFFSSPLFLFFEVLVEHFIWYTFSPLLAYKFYLKKKKKTLKNHCPRICNIHLQLIQVVFQTTYTASWVAQVPYNNNIILIPYAMPWFSAVIHFAFSGIHCFVLIHFPGLHRHFVFYKLRFVANLHQTSPLVLFFKGHLLTLCLCVTFFLILAISLAFSLL